MLLHQTSQLAEESISGEGTLLCFSSALIWAPASSPRVSCLLDFLHSEWIQHLSSSLWNAKLPVTHAWKYRARAMNSGLSFSQKESHFWSAILMRGLESIHVLSLFSLVWIPLLWLHNFLYSLRANFYSLLLGAILRSPQPLTSPRIQVHKGSCTHSLKLWLQILPLCYHPIPLGKGGRGVSLREQTEENLSNADS